MAVVHCVHSMFSACRDGLVHQFVYLGAVAARQREQGCVSFLFSFECIDSRSQQNSSVTKAALSAQFRRQIKSGKERLGVEE